MMTQKRQISWVPHRDPFKKARSVFTKFYMSNAKWRKALRAIATAELCLTRSEWKWIDSDAVTTYGIPRLTDILENRFEDGMFQPVEYKWIEWVRFPRSYKKYPGKVYKVTQDIDGLSELLQSCGKLRIEVDEGGLTLIAYEL